MSQYLRVLKRIEKDRDGAAPSSAPVRRVPSKADVTASVMGDCVATFVALRGAGSTRRKTPSPVRWPGTPS